MKNKNFAIMVGVLVVLIVIFLFQQLNTDKKSISESLIDIFPDLNAASISAIKVYKQDYPDSGLSFVKKDGTVFHFCKNKCQKNMLELKRIPRKIRWSKHYAKK